MTTSVLALTFVTRQKKLPSSSGLTGGVKMVVACAAVASTTDSTPAIRNLRKRLIVDILRARIAQCGVRLPYRRSATFEVADATSNRRGWYRSQRGHGGHIGARACNEPFAAGIVAGRSAFGLYGAGGRGRVRGRRSRSRGSRGRGGRRRGGRNRGGRRRGGAGGGRAGYRAEPVLQDVEAHAVGLKPHGNRVAGRVRSDGRIEGTADVVGFEELRDAPPGARTGALYEAVRVDAPIRPEAGGLHPHGNRIAARVHGDRRSDRFPTIGFDRLHTTPGVRIHVVSVRQDVSRFGPHGHGIAGGIHGDLR